MINMELYKFISENEIKKYRQGFVIIDNRIYTNPSEEVVKKAGYKPLVAAEEIPEHNKETEYLVRKYKDDGENITEYFEVVPVQEG